jgi:hypothetical protein
MNKSFFSIIARLERRKQLLSLYLNLCFFSSLFMISIVWFFLLGYYLDWGGILNQEIVSMFVVASGLFLGGILGLSSTIGREMDRRKDKKRKILEEQENFLFECKLLISPYDCEEDEPKEPWQE